ncbi:hypothetical protein Pmar_PMAR016576 [Perkinsus marinus ATCC 50983]|uniref:Uncharacterized protein n=1 Tax=Perkinsus marinus (strain ATCC 50983 / TXsc) TaxID=423536 RepID=C5KTJ6_PERM5|nr:hypothetical protein Pmar_PMAR016576 [Perkinsus marinus ATCC 50983]EER12175.1 hypothetical protein Pmar_PMAR016576 [Perkinsus marinus ATCC 50983]|eukprot:XP_002780380.1 hypothetical protein Pmar_PMAR016576 [Perkinsus marinus ATCC 50983]
MSGYVTLGGGDFRSTTISSRNHTATPDGSVSNPSSISIDKDRIAVGLVREGFAMEYRFISYYNYYYVIQGMLNGGSAL